MSLISAARPSALQQTHITGFIFHSITVKGNLVIKEEEEEHHPPLFIREIDGVLLVVALDLFVQFAGLCGQLVDLTPDRRANFTSIEFFTSSVNRSRLYLW